MYLDNRQQTPVRAYYQLWYAVMQKMDQWKDILTAKRSYATSLRVDLARKGRSTIWRKRKTRSQAKIDDWADGKYDGVIRDRSKRFGEVR